MKKLDQEIESSFENKIQWIRLLVNWIFVIIAPLWIPFCVFVFWYGVIDELSTTYGNKIKKALKQGTLWFWQL